MKKIIAVISAFSLAAAFCVNSFAASLGDVNGDGSVNSADALMVLQYSVGIKDKKFIKANADINGDGHINSSDALSILQISVGEYVSSFAADTLATYNKALQKSYDKVKKAVITTDFTCDYTLNGAHGAVKSSPQTDEFKFANGLFNGELPASTNTILHKTLFLCWRLCRYHLVCVIKQKKQSIFDNALLLNLYRK